MTEKTTMSDGSPVTDDHREIDPVTGMQKGYVVLSEEERAKGFVRPVRRTYIHVGMPGPTYPVRDLTATELERHARHGWVKFEKYPDDHPSGSTGRFWQQRQLDPSCGGVTTISRPLAETYARNPSFYGATFCSNCGTHFPVGEDGEFLWYDTEERVGT